MDVDAQSGVADDLLAALAAWVGGGQVVVVRVVGLQDVLAVTVFGDHPQQVLVVAAVVLPLDGHHAPCNRTRTAWRDQFQQQIAGLAR